MKRILLLWIERIILNFPVLVFWLLDNPFGRRLFLRKFLLNRPQVFEAYYKARPLQPRSKYVLILKPDAIGDYILFRNHLELLCTSEEFKGFRFVLVGNILWEDLARIWESKWISRFYFMDRTRFRDNGDTRYRYAFQFELNRFRYHTAIYFVHSREWLAGDWVMQHIAACHKISSSGDFQCQNPNENKVGNSVYSLLVPTQAKRDFEWQKHNQFSSAILNREISGVSFRLPEVPPIHFQNSAPYSVFFPGAGAALRQWDAGNFRELAAEILSRQDGELLVCGGPSDREAGELIREANPQKIRNLCGETDLAALVHIVKGARLLVSNESSAVHIAAFLGTRTVCISNGNHYGRFNPYSGLGVSFVKTVYPRELELLSEEDRIRLYYQGSDLNIQTIPVGQVLENLNLTGINMR